MPQYSGAGRNARGRGGDLVKWYRGVVRDQEEVSVDEAHRFAEDGKAFMQQAIASRGTGYEGRAGRIVTGKMYNAVQARSGKQGPEKSRGQFGWLTTRLDYFRFQEGGFRNSWTGNMVAGMYAMQDAAEFAMEGLRRRMERRGYKRNG